VLAGDPFQKSTASGPKLLPTTVIVNAGLPTGTVLGDSMVTAGGKIPLPMSMCGRFALPAPHPVTTRMARRARESRMQHLRDWAQPEKTPVPRVVRVEGVKSSYYGCQVVRFWLQPEALVREKKQETGSTFSVLQSFAARGALFTKYGGGTMRRMSLLLTLVLCVSAGFAQPTRNEVIPAGTLLQCTLSEPNFSSKTAAVGDPVLCHLGSLAAFGHPLFPRGAELGGHLQDYRNPGHFVGKGWMDMEFDRLVLPGGVILPLAAKMISAPHLRVDAEGKIHGGGHPKRDAIEWMIPVLWPIKVMTLPARGPYPALKGETRISLRLMEDVEVELPAAAKVTVPAPPWAETGSYHSPSDGVYRPAVDNYQARMVPSPHASAASFQRGDDQQDQLTLLVLRGGAAFVAREYWVEGGDMHCISSDGEQKLFALERVDLNQTVLLNRERNIDFVLRSRDAVEQ
jgi:hypothetical protein